MLRQAENTCSIEGILSEIKLENRSYTKNGKTNECISGEITIATEETINNQKVDLEIPVRVFVNKITNAGSINPAYESMERVMTEFKSIAAVGIDQADRVRISRGDIRMNEYYPRGSERLTSFVTINASFISRVKASDYKPSATFNLEFSVAKKEYEVGADGEETGRYKITALVPQYGENVDVMPLFSVNDNVTSIISEYWEEGQTVKAAGKLNFSSKTEEKTVEVDFGEAQSKTYTRRVSELIITGGAREPLSEEYAFSAADLQAGLNKRKATLEQRKADSAEKAKKNTTKAPTMSSAAIDLGF